MEVTVPHATTRAGSARTATAATAAPRHCGGASNYAREEGYGKAPREGAGALASRNLAETNQLSRFWRTEDPRRDTPQMRAVDATAESGKRPRGASTGSWCVDDPMICIEKRPKDRAFGGAISEGVYLGQRVAIYCRVTAPTTKAADARNVICARLPSVPATTSSPCSGKPRRVPRTIASRVGKWWLSPKREKSTPSLSPNSAGGGRSTQDLVQTLDDLHSWKVSVLAQPA